MLPPPLLTRLCTSLKASRLIRPVVATYTDDSGLHWLALVRDGDLYVNTAPHPFSASEVLAATLKPLYSLPVSQAAQIRDALDVYRGRIGATLVCLPGGVA